MKRTRGVGAVSIRPVLWVLLAGAACVVLVAGQRALDAREARELAAIEQQARADALADQQAFEARQAALADVKAHPEKYRASFKKTIQPTEQVSMAWAKGEQTLSTAYHGELGCQNLGYVTTATSVAVGAFGATVELAVNEDAIGETGIANPWFADPLEHETDDPPPDGYSGFGTQWYSCWWLWKLTATAPDSTSDTAYYLLYVGDSYEEPQTPYPGPAATEIQANALTATWAIGLTNAFRKAQITESIPADHAYMRDVRQRTGSGAWWGGTETTVQVTASAGGDSVSADGNYGLGEDTNLTAAGALGLTVSFDQEYFPAPDTDYLWLTANAGGTGNPIAIPFDHMTFYKTVGGDGDWHWMGDTTCEGWDPTPDAEDVLWRAFGSGNTLHLQAGDAYTTGGEAFSALLQCNNVDIYLALKKANGEPWGATLQDYGAYDDSAGHPFHIGRYVPAGMTPADVTCAPTGNEPIQIREVWTFNNGGIPDDRWRFLTNAGDGLQVRLFGPWCIANDEDVQFTDPLTMDDVIPGEDTHILQALTFHPLDGTLTDPPWRDDWITWTRTERNLDVPPGATERPSDWTGSGGAVVAGDTWTIPASGGTIERALATRRRNRIARMNAHLWTGSGDRQEVNDDWPLMTRANLSIQVTGDDPKWWDPEEEPWPGEEVGVEFEDVTDWRMFSCVRLHATGASADQLVTLRLTYRTLSGSNPYYTGARWKYGPDDGEFAAEWSAQQTATVTATLYAATGYAVFDLAPDAGNLPLDLELVEKVEFLFAGSGVQDELTFAAWETVPYSGSGSDEVTARVAHLCSSDYFGIRTYVDGMPNYQPTYLYSLDDERVEVGYKNQQDRQHNPDYEGDPQDLRYLKDLLRIVNEMQWAESLLEPSYSTEAIAAALQDEDENWLATPKCGDFDSVHENGFAIHVGTDLDVSFPVHTVYCTVILQGGVRAIMKEDGQRHVGQDATLYEDLDGTLTALQTRQTDAQGMVRLWAGREKPTRTYYVGALAVGRLVNVEEAWTAIEAPALYWDPHLAIDAFGGVWRVAETGGNIRCHVADARHTMLWQSQGRPFGSGTGYSRPTIAACDDGSIIVAATFGTDMVFSRLRVRGGAWEVVTTATIGNGIQAGGIYHAHGCIIATGWKNDTIVLRIADRESLEAAQLTPTATELIVCEAVRGEDAPIPRSAVVQQSDGSIVVVVDSGDGTMLAYRSRSHDRSAQDAQFELVG